MANKSLKFKITLPELAIANNPVAKHAHKFNKAQIYASKKAYSRKAKHANLESFILLFVADTMINGFIA